jgi:transcriptional regulator with XRE-family HTH domain
MSADPVTAVFAASLTRLREKRGLSRCALARLAGVGLVSVNRVEDGKGGPCLATAGKLAAALGVPLADMIGGSSLGPVPAPDTGPGTSEPFELTDHDGSVLQVGECAQDLHGYLHVQDENGQVALVCVEPDQIDGLAAALYRACGSESLTEAAHG